MHLWKKGENNKTEVKDVKSKNPLKNKNSYKKLKSLRNKKRKKIRIRIKN